MPEEIDVACPGCNAIFGVPLEFCGETAECAECGTMFEIPTLNEKADGQLDNTETGAIKGVEASDVGEATNTVRLSRTGIGMIPQVKDNFHLGGPPPGTVPSSLSPQSIPAAPVAPSSPPSQVAKTFARPPASPMAPQPPSSSAAVSSIPEPQTEEVSSGRERGTVPEWTNIRMRKSEEVLGVREVSSSSGGIAFIISIPAIVAGAVGLAQNFIGGMVVAAVGVGIVWGAVFIAAMLMCKGGSRKALVVTNQRAVCIVGKERMEVKQ